MIKIDQDDILFMISKRSIQQIAQEKLGRQLSEEELEVVKKGLESGLYFDVDSVFDAAFDEL